MKRDRTQRQRTKEPVFLGETLSRLPLVEIAGNKRVLVENHMGIVKYGAEEIGVKVRHGTICVKGSHLEIACISKDKLVICGQIEGIRFYSGGD